METSPSLHPADETLVSYGLGKLDDTVADRVGRHVEHCAPCRQRVADLSDDSFVERMRGAKQVSPAQPAKEPPQPVNEAARRTKTLVEPESAASSKQPRSAAGITVPGSEPPSEFVNHPQYEVMRELGRGGMGVVYLARNRLMDRLEVLKIVDQDKVGNPERVDRFVREIRAAAKLQHQNVVTAYNAFPLGKMLVFAMEYIEGDDLAKLLRARGPLPIVNACYFAYQSALGLQHAHERGMIHRDIKPGNLILYREGRKGIVKILDFGLAKVNSEERIDTDLTGSGQMLGTPDYIAPEQTLDAQNSDIRADIYSLGCTLYHLLTGSPPFSGNSLYEVLQAHHSTEAKMVNLVRPEVPVELAAVVAKMMAKEPQRRYQTPAEVAQALKPFFKPGALTPQQPQLSQTTAQANPEPERGRPAVPPGIEDDGPLLEPMPEADQRWRSLIDAPAPSTIERSRLPRLWQRRPKWLWQAVAGVTVVLLGLAVAWATGAFKAEPKTAAAEAASASQSPAPSVVDATVGNDAANRKTPDAHGASMPATVPTTVDHTPSSLIGGWEILDGELVKVTRGDTTAEIQFGDPHWTDYDFSIEMLRHTGDRACCIEFRAVDPDNLYGFYPTVSHNKSSALAIWENGQRVRFDVKPRRLTDNYWYKILIKVRGNHSETYIEGSRLLEMTDSRCPSGRVGLKVLGPICKFRNIHITDPSGKTLWDGLPNLGAQPQRTVPPKTGPKGAPSRAVPRKRRRPRP